MRGTPLLLAVFAAALLAAGLASPAAAAPAANNTTSACAATPPPDHADPEGDPLGWENGVWYSENIHVDQSDGLSDQELNITIARTMARVEALRCLEFQRDVDVAVWSEERVSNHYNHTHNGSDALRRFDNAKYESLFLVNESTNSITTQRQNAHSAVAGFYLPGDDGGKIIIVESDGKAKVDEPLLAHELVHGLQYQHFNIDPPQNATRDRRNAYDAVIEGDPSYVQHLYNKRCRADNRWDCLDAGRHLDAQLSQGTFLVKVFPYFDGLSFVQRIRGLHGWSGVNDLYKSPPQSSEVVIHPAKYGLEQNTPVSLTDRNNDSWERVRPPGRPDYATVGESSLMVMFVYPNYDNVRDREPPVPSHVWINQTPGGGISRADPFNYHSRYSDGWNGDRLHVYHNGDGELAYVWKLQWDGGRDIDEFKTGYRKLLNYWGATKIGEQTYRLHPGSGYEDSIHIITDRQNKTITIVNAPTTDQLNEVYSPVTVEHIDHPDIPSEDPDTNETTTSTPEDGPGGGSGVGGFGLIPTLIISLLGLGGLAFAVRELLEGAD